MSDEIKDLPRQHDALSAFYLRHSAWLLARLTRRHGKQDAEDILQDTWLRLAQSGPISEVRHPRAFLIRIASNLAINRSVRRARRSTQRGDLAVLEEYTVTYPSQAEHVALAQIILGLPEALRDRIVIGEMRDGAAALETLKSWNTGHPGGLSTLHANSAEDALRRIEDLALEVAAAPPRRTIAQAVDLIVHIRRAETGRRVERILAVDGVRGEDYALSIVA